MKKALLIVVAILAVAFFIGNAELLAQFGQTLLLGEAIPLIIAVIVTAGRYLIQAQSYNAGFEAVGFKTGFWHNVKLIFSLVFINTFCLFSGATGLAFIIDDAHRKGADGGQASSGAILTQIGYFAAVLIICALGTVMMLISGGENSLFLFGTLVLVLVLLVLSSFYFIGYFKPQALYKLMSAVELVIRKGLSWIRRDFREGWGKEQAQSFIDASKVLASNPWGVFVTIAYATLSAFCNMGCLVAIGFAFGYTHVIPLVAAFAVAAVSIQVSPTPQGIGITEAAITLVLTGHECSVETAAAIALVYRGIMLWLPFLVGAVLLSQTGFFKGSTTKSAETHKIDVAWISGTIMALLGLVNIALVLFSAQLMPYAALTQFVDLQTHGIQLPVAVLHVVGGLIMVALGVGLIPRIRDVWAASTVVIIALAAMELWFGVVQVAIAFAAFAIWLIVQRRAFDVAGPITTWFVKRHGKGSQEYEIVKANQGSGDDAPAGAEPEQG